jgi:hypothetical protein
VSAATLPRFIGNASSGTQGANADLAELIEIKGATTPADLAAIEAYFKSKYAL